MSRFKKILAPTDLSENSRVGLSYAIASARDCGAELIVLHVASESLAWQAISDEMGFVNSNTYTWTVDRIVNEAALDLNRFLASHLHEIKDVPGARKKVVLGQVVERIVETALQEEADLIVMAKRRRGTLSRLVSRSVSERVAREAPCPVLSICPPLRERPRSGKKMSLIHKVLQGSEA